jgi:hypothetical protein
MCKKPDPAWGWQKSWGYTDIKENTPEDVAFPVLIKACECGRNWIAYVSGGTEVMAEKVEG